MKWAKYISFCFILLFASFAYGNEYFSPSSPAIFIVESVSNENSSNNWEAMDSDFSEIDISFSKNFFSFSLMHLSGEKVIIASLFLPGKIIHRIWLPPEIAC